MTESISVLIEKLSHLDKNTRIEAALALGSSGDTRALDALISLLCTEPDLYVRENVTWSLVRLGAPAVPPLIALMAAPDAEVRHNAAHALGKLGDLRAFAALVRGLSDCEPKVALKSAYALGQIGDIRAVPVLVAQLGAENRDVHAMLSTVLDGFGAAALEPLRGALADPCWQVREHAADIIGLIGDRSTLAALTAAAADAAWQVRFAAVSALDHLGGPAARSAIANLPEDGDSRVRGLVERVLARSPGRAF